MNERQLSSFNRAAAVGRAFSGSWLGYHVRVYYAGLQAPPPGAHFSQEWGLMDMSLTSIGSVGDWREFQSEAILDHIRTQAVAAVAGAPGWGNFPGVHLRNPVDIANRESGGHDTYLSKLLTDLEVLQLYNPMEILDHRSLKGQKMTRDTIVLGQGDADSATHGHKGGKPINSAVFRHVGVRGFPQNGGGAFATVELDGSPIFAPTRCASLDFADGTALYRADVRCVLSCVPGVTYSHSPYAHRMNVGLLSIDVIEGVKVGYVGVGRLYRKTKKPLRSRSAAMPAC